MAVDMVKLAMIIKAANNDPDKGKELMNDPRTYLTKEGIEVPENAVVNFIPGTRSCGCYTAGAGAHVTVGWPG